MRTCNTKSTFVILYACSAFLNCSFQFIMMPISMIVQERGLLLPPNVVTFSSYDISIGGIASNSQSLRKCIHILPFLLHRFLPSYGSGYALVTEMDTSRSMKESCRQMKESLYGFDW